MKKKRGDGFWRTKLTPFQTPGRFHVPNTVLMVIPVSAILNEIFRQGRNYNWKKPTKCPRCHSVRVWGHGFVAAFFDGFDESLMLRRYRCPDCKCILRMKPKGYFLYFRAPIERVRACLCGKLSSGRWPCGLSVSRQRHWLSALKRKATAFFGVGTDLMAAFDTLCSMGQIPVSRSL